MIMRLNRNKSLPDHISGSELFTMIEPYKVKGPGSKRFGRKKFTRDILNEYTDEVNFTPKAIVYDKGDGGTKETRGLNEKEVRKILHFLHRDGYIGSATITLHKRFGLSKDENTEVVGVIGRSSSSAPLEEAVSPSTHSSPPAGKRETWGEANSLLVRAVKKNVPLSNLISSLISAGLRQEPLPAETVLRQMERLRDSGEINKESLIQYKRNNGIAARGGYKRQRAEPERVTEAKSSLKSPWGKHQSTLLSKLINEVDPLPGETGATYFERVAGQFNESGLRVVTGPSCRKQAPKLIGKGITSERYSLVNRSREEKLPAGSPTPIENEIQRRKEESLGINLESALTEEAKEKAIEMYLTPERRREAYRGYFKSLGVNI